MTYEEYESCLDDLRAMLGEPENERVMDLWWRTAQCKDARCWRRATDMIIEQKRFKKFPTLGDFMQYYESAANAMKYDRPARVPLSNDLEAVRRVDNAIYGLSKQERDDLQAQAVQAIREQQEEILQSNRTREATGFSTAGTLLHTSPILNTARIRQAMRDLYQEEYR